MVERAGFLARLSAALLLPVLAGAAHASYNDECRALAERLDRDPGALKVGELDLLKNCLADLQRIIVLSETPPAKKPPQECPPPPPAAPCPVCKACPAADPAAVAREREREKEREREREKERDREADRQLRPFLPKY